MDVAMAPEKVRRKDVVENLRFLETEDVGLLLANEAIDERHPRTHGIDVPGCDLQPFAHGSRLLRLAP